MESKIIPPASFINLGRLRLESHVREALELAWRLAGGRPVAAAHLLKSAVLLARGTRSGAFRKLASLLPLERLPRETATKVPPPDLAAIPFAPPLARSSRVATSPSTISPRSPGAPLRSRVRCRA